MCPSRCCRLRVGPFEPPHGVHSKFKIPGALVSPAAIGEEARLRAVQFGLSSTFPSLNPEPEKDLNVILLPSGQPSL